MCVCQFPAQPVYSFCDPILIIWICVCCIMCGGSCLCVSHSVLDDVHERLRELHFLPEAMKNKNTPMVLECNMGHVNHEQYT